MKLSIDAELCQGHGRCYELAPELFTDDERGRGWVTNAEPDESLREQATAAVNACPERAISISD
ncbi:ferredoxin [Jatrophihabitans sp. DSM 45814]